MASIAISWVASDSFSVYASGLDTNYSYNDRTVTWSCAGQIKSASLGAKVSSGGGVTFTGLSPDTAYTVSCTISYKGGSASLSRTVTTSPKTYTVTVDNNDAGISAIDVSSNGTANTVGSGEIFMTKSVVYGGASGGNSYTFYATPAAEFAFSYWQYTLYGSATIYRAYSNPFVYTGAADITVSAVSGTIAAPEPTADSTALIGGQEYEMLIYDGTSWGVYELCP